MHRLLTALRRGFKKRIGWKRLGIAASLLIIAFAITTLVRTLKGVDTGVVLIALTEISPSRIVLARFRAELERLLPRARRAEVLDSFVTRERRATFDQVPGCTVLRPEPGAGPGVLRLAGAWTDTGWPDTMESAVRSGIRAAETVLRIPSEERRRFAA